MASNSTGSEDIPAAPSPLKRGAGGTDEWTPGAWLASELRAGTRAALTSAVAYFGRTEPASEQCEANR